MVERTTADNYRLTPFPKVVAGKIMKTYLSA